MRPFRLGLETIYGETKRNGAKESHLIRSHTEAGETLFSSQQQLLAQRHPPTPTFAFGQLYRFATLAIVYKVFSFVLGGVTLPSGVRCCFAFGRLVSLVLFLPSVARLAFATGESTFLASVVYLAFGLVNTPPPSSSFGGSPGLCYR